MINNLPSRLSILATLVILGLFMFSCNTFQTKGEAPAYIYIDKITLQIDDPSSQGSAKGELLDAWVYVDNQLLGAFELPALVPCLDIGKRTVTIRAGIIQSGNPQTRRAYDMLSTYQSTVELGVNQTDTIKPVVKYYAEAKFSWLEDFENKFTLVKKDGDTIPLRDTTLRYEGKYSGLLSLGDTNKYLIAYSRDSFLLPKSGAHVYLEMDYITTSNLAMGIVVYESGTAYQEPIFLFASTANKWQKVYLYLTPSVSRYTKAEYYKIFFGIRREAVGKVHANIDNLKLLHF